MVCRISIYAMNYVGDCICALKYIVTYSYLLCLVSFLIDIPLLSAIHRASAAVCHGGVGWFPGLFTALMKRCCFLSSSYLLISATATGDYITVGVYAWGSVVILPPSQTPSGPQFGPSQILLMVIILY